jgi:hypothetical protein
MRSFKLSDHNLLRWQDYYNWETKQSETNAIIPGKTKVCGNRLEYMGVVTNLTQYGKPYTNNKDYIVEVEVLWLSGPRKGTKQLKATRELANFNAYKDDVQSHLNEIENIEKEAAKTGM